MANYEQTKYDINAANLTGIQGVNTGLVIPWGSTSVPSGFLECNGSAVSRSTYAALFAVIGTTYGSGNGSTTFNVPDLTDKTILSRSNNKALASTGGANTVVKTGSISGTVGATTLTTCQIPAHSHSSTAFKAAPMAMCQCQCSVANIGMGNSGSAGGGGSHDHTLSANFVGNATSVLQPYLTLIYIIKT
jgi:microcystin-dependent protein